MESVSGAGSGSGSGSGSAVAPAEQTVSPMQLSLEQLNTIKTQLEEDLNELQRQLETLSNARGRFSTAKATLLDMKTCKEDEKLLIPLHSSLYVPGKLLNPNKVKRVS